MMGRWSRQKGKRFEREIASALRQIFGAEIKRGWQTRSGADAPDVDGSPFWVECKHGARPSPLAAMRQAIAATDGRVPIVVARRNQGRTVVTMRRADWAGLHETARLGGYRAGLEYRIRDGQKPDILGTMEALDRVGQESGLVQVLRTGGLDSMLLGDWLEMLRCAREAGLGDE